MSDLSFMVLKVVISVCVFLVTVYVIPYLDALRKNEKFAALMDAIINAVQAAEQVVGRGQGDLKKRRVMEDISSWLLKHHIEMTTNELSELVESAVYSMNAAKGA